MTPYFAYGSNMLRARIEERLGHCEPLGQATLPGHRLAFHKRGADGSAKCDAHFTGRPQHQVIGVLYAVDSGQLERLDEFEGAGYRRDRLELNAAAYGACTAWLYRAEDHWIDAALPPWDWYHALVVAGAVEHRLPDSYLAGLLRAPVQPDPDSARSSRHWPLADSVNATGPSPLPTTTSR
ncbi:MAG: gamma-glutamylcyclotransferase [Gammaproteobacteria bacterium]|jgi:hypothetical protein|nr:gamma-glutamylcyclotransferase [Gammaproteobacteria bacterium]